MTDDPRGAGLKVQSKESGLRTMDQGFTPGSGVPPSRLGD